MSNALFSVPATVNEPLLQYGPGSPERAALKKTLDEFRSKEVEIPMVIGSERIQSSEKLALHVPHDHKHVLGHYYRGSRAHVKQAIAAALKAKESWMNTPWEQRAAIFLKAADLLAGPYRFRINAATMLCQSKNAYQAEIDAACETIDFFRMNVKYMSEIYAMQPLSSLGAWNRLEYRPLEGFVYAITPFNFTAIAGNLPASAALMGNVVVWKPSDKQIYSSAVLMEVFQEAGLPPGVINMIFTDPEETSAEIFSHPDFAGIHFTGSTAVFKHIWKTIGNNIDLYRNFPRIVGETGGKDFILVHTSADVKVAGTALIRGAFEYQGQKCSAASRAYIPSSLWEELKSFLLEELKTIKTGPVEDFGNFVNAVIDERSYDKLVSFIEAAKNDEQTSLLAGGKYSKESGYFIEPTLILTSDPHYVTMREELFGPVLTIYVYEEADFEQMFELIDRSTNYALTGSIIATDREVIALAEEKLTYSAGNFYINDKCTGAVVGQQPFGGARSSGTDDKAGSALNLLRWVSARTIKETLTPPTSYRYPFIEEA